MSLMAGAALATGEDANDGSPEKLFEQRHGRAN